MRLKFLYTLVLIFSMSAFASSNECSRVCREGHAHTRTGKEIPVSGTLISAESTSQEEMETTPFQIIKFLYI